MLFCDVLKLSLAKQQDYIKGLRKKGFKLIIQEKMEEGLEDISRLNDFYNKGYITLEEFNKIKNKIVDKMIEQLQKEGKDDYNVE